MADIKITDLTDIGTPSASDVLEIVDVSDTTDSPEGTSKKVEFSTFAGNIQAVLNNGNEIIGAQQQVFTDTDNAQTIIDANSIQHKDLLAEKALIINGNTIVRTVENGVKSVSIVFDDPTGETGSGEIIFPDVADNQEITAYQSYVNAEISSKQDALTETNFGTFTSGLTTVDAIADGDIFNYSDASDSNKQKKTLWSNIKSVLKTYFDGLYSKISDTTITTGANSSGTTQTVSLYMQVDGTKISTGDQLELIVRTFKVGTAGTLTVRTYANATPNILGSPILISTTQSVASTLSATQQRFLDVNVKDGTGAGTYASLSSNTAIVTDYANITVAGNNLAIDWGSNPYIVVTVQCANAGDVATVKSIKLRK